MISGTVWLHDVGGVTAAPAGSVFGWVHQPRWSQTTGQILIAETGRYQFGVATDTIDVSVYGGPGFQPCAAWTVVGGDTTLDLHRVIDRAQLGANLPAELRAKTPTLSGVVYEETSRGRQPISNASIELDGADGLGLLVATTITDAEGRYVLCAVPQKPEMTLVIAATDFTLKYVFNAELAHRTNLDIEMRRIGVTALR